MPMVRAMRLLNAIEAGTLNGAQLQTLLMNDTGRLAEFSVLMGMRGQVRRMAASSTAMAAVIASSTAMTAVAASSTAMAVVAASSPAKMAIFNSDTALAEVAASSTALTALRASPQYKVSRGTTDAISGLDANGSYIVVGLSSTNATAGGVNVLTRRSGSSVSMYKAATGVLASNALTYPVAMPMVAPFSVANTSTAWTWYVGTVRCDV